MITRQRHASSASSKRRGITPCSRSKGRRFNCWPSQSELLPDKRFGGDVQPVLVAFAADESLALELIDRARDRLAF
jgi:hypothetical protein